MLGRLAQQANVDLAFHNGETGQTHRSLLVNQAQSDNACSHAMIAT